MFDLIMIAIGCKMIGQQDFLCIVYLLAIKGILFTSVLL